DHGNYEGNHENQEGEVLQCKDGDMDHKTAAQQEDSRKGGRLALKVEVEKKEEPDQEEGEELYEEKVKDMANNQK
ncbi:hypothetical protein C0993_006289, partial [Termitomyces sp. T159_Od127]